MAEKRGRGFLFQEVEIQTPERSEFDMSFENRYSCNMSYLVPVSVQELVPGDRCRCRPQFFSRFAPMLAPIMHQVDLFHYTFFVPNRLVWKSWQDFISPGDGKKTMKNLSDGSYVPPAKPWLRTTGNSYDNYPSVAKDQFFKRGCLIDYMGAFGVPDANGYAKRGYLDALPFRAYQLIFDEYFRDQNVTPSLDISLEDGLCEDNGDVSETSKLLTLRKKSWEHDYFTSALPEPQRGPDVFLPLGDTAPLKYDHNKGATRLKSHASGSSMPGSFSTEWHPYPGSNPGTGEIYPIVGDNGVIKLGKLETESQTQDGQYVTNLSNVIQTDIDVTENTSVDLSQATSVTINTLRQANALQKFLEKSARVGGRYIESILAHFGVNVPDSRLQRPEFISAGRIPVQISATTADAASNVTDGRTTWLNVQGTQTGNAISSGQDSFEYVALEHGFLITLSCVLPRTAYMQGIKRMFFNRKTYLDYPWPVFGHLGEQEVFNAEIYASPESSTDAQSGDINAENKGTFGYQSRYADIKYNADEVHGDFCTSLDFWHMARKFDNRPLLNESFITANPTNRIWAITDESVHHIYVDLWFEMEKESAFPLYGTPAL